MGRIRCIKPEFPQSFQMGRVSRESRLLFILLWTLADDSGRARASSRMLASLLYPYDEDVPGLIGGWLQELQRHEVIDLYEVAGEPFISIRNWLKHQRINRPSPSKLPSLSEGSVIAHGVLSESSVSPHCGKGREVITASTVLESSVVARTSDLESMCSSVSPHGALTEPSVNRKRSKPVDRPEDVPEQVWADWVAHRKAKKATVTATVLEQFRREAAKASVTLEAALRESVARGWQGFRADWWKRDNAHQTDFSAVNYREGAGDDGRF